MPTMTFSRYMRHQCRAIVAAGYGHDPSAWIASQAARFRRRVASRFVIC